MFCELTVPKCYAKFAAKDKSQSTSLQHETSLKKRVRIRYLSVNFNKLLRKIYTECLGATAVISFIFILFWLESEESQEMGGSNSLSDSEDSDQSVHKTPLNSIRCRGQMCVCMEE